MDDLTRSAEQEKGTVPSGRLRISLFAVYVLLCAGAMTWPGYALFGNSIEPYVLGLPFSLAWVVGWVILTLLALTLFHATRPPEEGG